MMANQIVLTLEKLKISIGAQDPRSASIAIDAIIQNFDDIVSESETGMLCPEQIVKYFKLLMLVFLISSDFRIDKVFSENGGLIGFQKLAIKSNKLFKDENVKIFKLYGKIIELHEKKMPPYAESIMNVRRPFHLPLS